MTERRTDKPRDSGVRLTLDNTLPPIDEDSGEEWQEARQYNPDDTIYLSGESGSGSDPEEEPNLLRRNNEAGAGAAGDGNGTDTESEESQGTESGEEEEQNMAVQANQLNSIEALTGESGDEAERFIATMVRAAQLFGWDDATTCNIALAKMSKKAQDWIRAEQAIGRTYTSWVGVAANANAVPPVAAAPSLKAALQQRFGEARTVGTAVAAMANLKQKHDETVSGFYDRVRLAVEKKNYNVADANRDDAYRAQMREDIRTFLICGLRKEYQERVLGVANPPETLEEIMEVIQVAEKEYQTQIRAISALQEGETPIKSEEHEDGASSINAISAGTGRGRGGYMTGRGRGFGGQNQPIRCYYCNNLGHIARECRKKMADNRRNRGNYQRGGYGPRRGMGPDRARPISALDYDQMYQEWKAREPIPPSSVGDSASEYQVSENY